MSHATNPQIRIDPKTRSDTPVIMTVKDADTGTLIDKAKITTILGGMAWQSRETDAKGQAMWMIPKGRERQSLVYRVSLGARGTYGDLSPTKNRITWVTAKLPKWKAQSQKARDWVETWPKVPRGQFERELNQKTGAELKEYLRAGVGYTSYTLAAFDLKIMSAVEKAEAAGNNALKLAWEKVGNLNTGASVVIGIILGFWDISTSMENNDPENFSKSLDDTVNHFLNFAGVAAAFHPISSATVAALSIVWGLKSALTAGPNAVGAVLRQETMYGTYGTDFDFLRRYNIASFPAFAGGKQYRLERGKGTADDPRWKVVTYPDGLVIPGIATDPRGRLVLVTRDGDMILFPKEGVGEAELARIFKKVWSY